LVLFIRRWVHCMPNHCRLRKKLFFGDSDISRLVFNLRANIDILEVLEQDDVLDILKTNNSLEWFFIKERKEHNRNAHTHGALSNFVFFSFGVNSDFVVNEDALLNGVESGVEVDSLSIPAVFVEFSPIAATGLEIGLVRSGAGGSVV